MTPQQIREAAVEEVHKATPAATLADIQAQAAAKATAFIKWLETGTVEPPPAK